MKNNTADIDKAGILMQLSSNIVINDTKFIENKATNSKGVVAIEMCNSIDI